MYLVSSEELTCQLMGRLQCFYNICHYFDILFILKNYKAMLDTRKKSSSKNCAVLVRFTIIEGVVSEDLNTRRT